MKLYAFQRTHSSGDGLGCRTLVACEHDKTISEGSKSVRRPRRGKRSPRDGAGHGLAVEAEHGRHRFKFTNNQLKSSKDSIYKPAESGDSMSDIDKLRQRVATAGQHFSPTNEQRGERSSMADAKKVRATLEKELARLGKASDAVEVKLKSASDAVITRVQALEKVVEKEFLPNVTAKLKAIEKELAAYKKASKKQLTRLKKAYDRELAKLRKAKGRVATKISKSSKAKPAIKKPAREKARRAAQLKTEVRKAAAQPKATAKKPVARKVPSSRRRKPAASTTTKRAAAKTTTRRKAGSATKSLTRKKTSNQAVKV